MNAVECVVHTIESDETTVNGTYTDSWDFFLDDPVNDTDGDGKLDPGTYKLVIDLKDSTGNSFSLHRNYLSRSLPVNIIFPNIQQLTAV